MYLLKEKRSKTKIKSLLFIILFFYFHNGYSQANYKLIYDFVINSDEFNEYRLRTIPNNNKTKIIVSKDIINFDAYAGIFYYQGLFSGYNVDSSEYDDIIIRKRTVKNGFLRKHSDYTLFFSETRENITFVEIYYSLINNNYPERYFGETLLLMIKIRNDKIIDNDFLRLTNN